MKLNFYSDPGHGWLAVKRSTLIELGIDGLISTYSYQRGNTVYLEEDCDYSTFAAAARARGIELSFIDKHTDRRSPIRSYEIYKGLKP
jgi:hypothetical protein